VKTMQRCLLALACASAAGAFVLGDDDDKKPVPLYTNEDLERVAPYRDQTGVNSKPAAAAAPAPPAARSRARADVRGEEYWRREAERARDRLRPLRERAAELRLRIEERRRQPPRRRESGAADAQIATLERRLRLLEDRIRETESRLEERARRERALPGWLR
jgi:hypothetical protein